MKLFGSRFARREEALRNSEYGRALRVAVEAAGHFDGSAESRQRAYETFMELAQEGPYDVSSPNWTVDGLAQDFADSLSSSSGPILVEAASMVVGAHRLAQHSEKPRRTRKERDADLNATALFSALFGDWVKAQTIRYRVGTPSAVAEQMLRASMMTWLMLDECARLGLLTSDEETGGP